MGRTILIVILGLIVCACGGAFFFSDIYGDRPDPNHAYYRLISDGDRLVVKHFPSGKEFVAVPGKGSGARVETRELNHQWQIDVYSGSTHESKVCRWIGPAFWSSKHSAAFFVVNTFPAESPSGEFVGEVWTWTKTGSFQSILRTNEDIYSLSETPDGKFLCLLSSTSGSGSHLNTRLIDVKTHSVAYIPVIWKGGVPFEVDQEHLIIEGFARVVNPRNAEIREMDAYLYEIVGFQGRVWGINRVPGKESVVRLSPGIDGFDKTIAIPSTFPKPYR